MDWRAVKFDWNRVRAFLVTAEEGSLSAAARALGTAQPTIGRQVEALEQALGVVLFERLGRGLSLTPSGIALLEPARAMAAAAGQLSLTAFGESQSLEGSISIAASEIYASQLLPPIIAKLRALEPGITIEIVASSRASDLKRREADIAIRNFRPTDPELIARKIKEVPARLYATPAYLAKIGTPKTLKDLSRAEFINLDSQGVFLEGLQRMGLDLAPSNLPILAEDYNVMWEMVKHGLGIGILDGTIGDTEPLVTRVLPDMLPLMFPVWLVAHRAVTRNRRIRMVFDLLATELSAPTQTPPR